MELKRKTLLQPMMNSVILCLGSALNLSGSAILFPFSGRVVGIAGVRLDGVDSCRSSSSIRYVTLEDRVPCLDSGVCRPGLPMQLATLSRATSLAIRRISASTALTSIVGASMIGIASILMVVFSRTVFWKEVANDVKALS
jgi:hypothetical protein